jgi:dTDP-4-dehydrorhamnose reductase
MKKKIIILGANGMLGHVLFNNFSKNNDFITMGTLRNKEYKKYFKKINRNHLIINKDIFNFNKLTKIIISFKPDIIINCIGIIKQKKFNNYENMIMINSLFPRKLSEICEIYKTKLILISTDCVFLGNKGNYKETDLTDAKDNYGISKILGEYSKKNNLILRTSIIGPELKSKNGLLEWLLSEKKFVYGFKNVYFSGVTTLELYKILKNYIIFSNLSGIYHIGSKKINKFELLNLISKIYEKKIDIKPSYKEKLDRSLNFKKFKLDTGYKNNKWIDMIKDMYQNKN